MKPCTERTRFSFSITRVLLAGLAGGMAEVLWVAAWSAVAPLQATAVAREITRTVLPGMAAAPMAAARSLDDRYTEYWVNSGCVSTNEVSNFPV